ncbi:unnamed protein product [Mycetohabitans rhizoxinica HKI 454]|uniref:Uncharacterized protein n=1 Tax=Mycetohabitans rhizoxinica (strain DSM 19002 / CIP 109453 / HKI 454) TaxID=882378 RepID=E5AT78_MYCRK|nr:unnamed protein product [Mycetohabitans rhizoxinica HKI 454]
MEHRPVGRLSDTARLRDNGSNQRGNPRYDPQGT